MLSRFGERNWGPLILSLAPLCWDPWQSLAQTRMFCTQWGRKTPGSSWVGALTAVTCLEFNEVNFCKDTSVTASQCVTWVYWLHPYQHHNLLLLQLLPWVSWLVKEVLTLVIITLIIKENILIVRHDPEDKIKQCLAVHIIHLEFTLTWVEKHGM